MSTVKEFNVNAFKGINTAAAPELIAPNEFTILENLIFDEYGNLIKRPGIEYFYFPGSNVFINFLKEYNHKTLNKLLLFNYNTKLYKFIDLENGEDIGAGYILPKLGSNIQAWQFINKVYFAIEDDYPRKYDGVNFGKIGIERPEKPIVELSGAGQLKKWYGYKAVFVTEESIGQSSTASDFIEADPVNGNSIKITIPQPINDPFVQKIRIYRTLAQNTAESKWYNENWKYRRKFKITNPAANGDVVDVQVNIPLDLTNFDFNKAKNDGTDLVIIDGDNSTIIEHWTEKWDVVNNEASLWIKVSMSAGAERGIYLYYGNNVYDNGSYSLHKFQNIFTNTITYESVDFSSILEYKSYYRVNSKIDTQTLEDSTANDNDGQFIGDMYYAEDIQTVEGEPSALEGGRWKDRQDVFFFEKVFGAPPPGGFYKLGQIKSDINEHSYISRADMNIQLTYSFSAWIKIDNTPDIVFLSKHYYYDDSDRNNLKTFIPIIYLQNGQIYLYYIYKLYSAGLNDTFYSAWQLSFEPHQIADGNWHYVSVYVSIGTDGILYVDGQEKIKNGTWTEVIELTSNESYFKNNVILPSEYWDNNSTTYFMLYPNTNFINLSFDEINYGKILNTNEFLFFERKHIIDWQRRKWTAEDLPADLESIEENFENFVGSEGVQYFFLREVDVGVTEIIDNLTDDFLSTEEIIYDIISPPKSKYLTFHNDRLFLANIKDYSSLLYYSNVLEMDIFNINNFIDINPDDGQEITGIVSLRGQLIIFKTNSIYKLYGDAESFQLVQITDKIGCPAPKTIYLYNQVIFFQSNDGIYMTDGQSISKISEQIKRDFDLIKNNLNTLFVKDNKLYLSLYSESDLDIVNTIYVYDITFRQWTSFRFNNYLPDGAALSGITYINEFNSDLILSRASISHNGIFKFNQNLTKDKYPSRSFPGNKLITHSSMIIVRAKTGFITIIDDYYTKIIRRIGLGFLGIKPKINIYDQKDTLLKSIVTSNLDIENIDNIERNLLLNLSIPINKFSIEISDYYDDRPTNAPAYNPIPYDLDCSFKLKSYKIQYIPTRRVTYA